ncbi:hypothetical protein [Shimia sp. Alg240-R146]|uniref:hypothetical protein n=1 Tax=Shimia sp. Alg240-R146 TaxID=2993449 RepID=UPI0022E071D4|nr:hypothetical protein [Shimia sp. Alg240-R146]
MALWGKALAVQRKGLDFRKSTEVPEGYLVKIGREVVRNLGLFAALVVLGLMVLPPAEHLRADEAVDGMPQVVSIVVQPLAGTLDVNSKD